MDFLTDVIAAGRSMASPSSPAAANDDRSTLTQVIAELEKFSGAKISADVSVLVQDIDKKITENQGRSFAQIMDDFQSRTDALVDLEQDQQVVVLGIRSDLSSTNERLAAMNDRMNLLQQSLADVRATLSNRNNVVSAGEATVDSDGIIVSDDDSTLLVRFSTGSAILSASAERTLQGYLRRPGLESRRVAVTGYADRRGSERFNVPLSAARAMYVADLMKAAGYNVRSTHGGGATKKFGPDFPLNRLVIVQFR
jgi:outer membrane protein OmpA-like peptidoglycan-associated protein